MSASASQIDREPRDVDEFLAAYEGIDGRREFVDGRVVEMMTHVTYLHAAVATNFLVALKTRLPTQFKVLMEGLGVETQSGIRFPDVWVGAREYEGTELKARSSFLVAEVLSTSTRRIDLGPKRAEYTRLPELLHYVTLEQDRPHIRVWSRDENGAFADAIIIEGMDGICELGGFGISIPLAEIYEDV